MIIKYYCSRHSRATRRRSCTNELPRKYLFESIIAQSEKRPESRHFLVLSLSLARDASFAAALNHTRSKPQGTASIYVYVYTVVQ